MKQVFKKENGIFLFHDSIVIEDDEILPEGYEEYLEEEGKYNENGELWEPPQSTLDEMKTAKIMELKQQCEATIIGGYQSAVILLSTGKAHLYPSDRDDQLNILGSAYGASLEPMGTLVKFKTKDTMNYEIHTQEEIKQVALEIKNHVANNLERVNDLVKQVLDPLTDTQEKLDLIVW